MLLSVYGIKEKSWNKSELWWVWKRKCLLGKSSISIFVWFLFCYFELIGKIWCIEVLSFDVVRELGLDIVICLLLFYSIYKSVIYVD